jgi:two-component sensor histidine kinase
MKYAFPGERIGEIKISLHQDTNGFIEMIVYDNGIGVDPNFDFINDSKFGLKTMTLIVENQLNGKMTISQNNGLQFSIRFKDNLYEKRV